MKIQEHAASGPTNAGAPAPRRFCAAPWLESVLYNDGSYRICSRNNRNFGDWRSNSLEGIWKGEELKAFRNTISGGHYPDNDCAACHSAGTYQSLERILSTPLNNALRFLVFSYLIVYEEYLYLQKIAELFSLDVPDAEKKIEAYEELIKKLLFRFRLEGHGEHLTKLKKIQNIVAIIKAYHQGDEAPPVVGPFRQVQLIAKCNARCVMCPGKFNGEIVTGGSIKTEELELAMSSAGDIVDFFCNGSEFLLFKGWKEVAQKLRVGGVASLRLSTNGMLLTKETSEYLVDNEVIGHLNISFNAGTKETLERVQKNVRWDRLLQNVDHLIAYAEEKKIYFPMSFSFIVMRSNFHELPAFLKLVADWKRVCRTLDPHVMIMSLENAGEKDYRFFLYDEHPAFAPREEMIAAFREAADLCEREKIVGSLYNYGPVKTLPEFVAAGFPMPEFFNHASADKENIEKCVRRVLEPFFQREFSAAKEVIGAAFDGAMSRDEVFPVGAEVNQANEAIDTAVASLSLVMPGEIADAETSAFRHLFEKFPEFREYFESYFAEWRGDLVLRLRGDLEVAGWEIFNAQIGFGRESLPDHFTEKYLRLPEHTKLSKVAIGARVLCKDFRVWRLVFKADLLVYVESLADGELLAAEHDFVIGAFLFDEVPASVLSSIAFRKLRAKAYFHAELECKYVELLHLGKEKIREAFGTAFMKGEKIPYGLARTLTENRASQAKVFVAYRRGLGSREVSDEIKAFFARFPDQEKLHERYRGRIERFCLIGLEDELRKFELQLFLEKLQMSRQEVIDHFGMQYVALKQGGSEDKLSPGTAILGADYKVWIFLRRRGAIVYLMPAGGTGMQLWPKDFIRGAFLFEDGPDERTLAKALRRADMHWRINTVKHRLLGERKSRTLWYLSRAYRFGLKGLGIETPSDMVIPRSPDS